MTATEIQTRGDEEIVEDLAAQLLDECDPKTHDSTTFLGAQFDKGLAWVHFPVGNGGLGLNPKLQKIVNERLSAGWRAERVLPQPDRVRHVRTHRGDVGQ